ncbi:hypothetical protein ON010_g16032 [Phytophthora cinnamomi]|nr:hypothetical protein ON010_g16032 [Phytophthora cinnamomi]
MTSDALHRDPPSWCDPATRERCQTSAGARTRVEDVQCDSDLLAVENDRVARLDDPIQQRAQVAAVHELEHRPQIRGGRVRDTHEAHKAAASSTLLPVKAPENTGRSSLTDGPVRLHVFPQDPLAGHDWVVLVSRRMNFLSCIQSGAIAVSVQAGLDLAFERWRRDPTDRDTTDLVSTVGRV